MATFGDNRIPERMWNKIMVDSSSTCWHWVGPKTIWGYGQVKIGGVNKYVHRIIAAAFNGDIPKGLDCSHKCGISTCCNPDHLTYETRSENMKRAKAHRMMGIVPSYDKARVKPIVDRYISKARRAK